MSANNSVYQKQFNAYHATGRILEIRQCNNRTTASIVFNGYYNLPGCQGA